MTIRQNGGVFGRNPEFNDVGVDGSADVNNLTVTGDVKITGFHPVGVENIGYGSLLTNIQAGAQYNIAMGKEALASLTTGDNNVAIGEGTLRAMATGSNCVAVGAGALRAVTSGNNTAVGALACYQTTTASLNVGVGYSALYANLGANYNTAVGHSALRDNTTGPNNTAVGQGAGVLNTTGAYNTFIGYAAGDTCTTGNGNTAIGRIADVSASNASNQIVIGSGVTGTANNRITVGAGANIAELDLDGVSTAWAASSDERLKKDIADYAAGLDFVEALRPVSFKWREKGEVDPALSSHHEAGSTAPVHGDAGLTYHGFIAQEVRSALDAHSEVVDGQGMWKLRDDGVQTVAPADLIPVLVNAIKELSARVKELEASK